MTTDPQVRYCTTTDGVQIAYAVDGNGPGIPVISMAAPFTHARPSYWEEFGMSLIGGVSLESRPLAWFDFRGCGLSERNVDDVSMDALERDLYALIERLEWPRFSLMASGMSGPLAMKYAAEHPDRVTSLVLRETYARAADMGRIPRMRALGLLLREDYESYLMLMVATARGWTSEGARLVELMAGTITERMCREYAAASPTFNANTFVEKIVARTLVIGRDDMPVPNGEMLRQLGARIRDARVVMEAGFGQHSPTVELFLAEADPVSDASPASPSTGTRTILFTDLVDHTAMMQRLGDAKGRAVLREHERITREALLTHGGAEVKTDGDSFMATFASVSSAVECAVALQRAFAQYSETNGEPIVVRMGLNVGEPIEEDGDVFGSSVILGARIKDQARGGEILVPEAVRHMLSGKSFLFADRGEFALKGFEDAVRLYEVRWRE